jgi:hypothetical protein
LYLVAFPADAWRRNRLSEMSLLLHTLVCYWNTMDRTQSLTICCETLYTWKEMPYPELLALLDSKIARLRYARDLLSTSALPESLVAREAPVPVMTQQAEAEILPATTEPVFAGLLQTVRQIKPRARRERRVVAKAKHLEPTALSGPLPSGPVFVPAVRMVKLESRTETNSAASFEKPTDMPTAAQLTQRWLHASS